MFNYFKSLENIFTTYRLGMDEVETKNINTGRGTCAKEYSVRCLFSDMLKIHELVVILVPPNTAPTYLSLNNSACKLSQKRCMSVYDVLCIIHALMCHAHQQKIFYAMMKSCDSRI